MARATSTRNNSTRTTPRIMAGIEFSEAEREGVGIIEQYNVFITHWMMTNHLHWGHS